MITTGVLSDAFVHCLVITIVLSGVPLLSGMVVGLIVSITQAATQIQEQTLSFIAKTIGVGVALYFCGDRLAQELMTFTQETLIVLGGR